MKHFKTNVLLKSILGKDLINDDNIAVNELVKNSYDANSKKVDIIFKNLKQNDDATNPVYSSKSSKIIIQDFGVGMLCLEYIQLYAL
ncbi:MAG: ATP-binding protein, partial [Ignavibacteriota bacterium]